MIKSKLKLKQIFISSFVKLSHGMFGGKRLYEQNHGDTITTP